MDKKTDSAILMWNLPIFSRSKSDLLVFINSRLNNKNGLLTIATPNPEQIVLSEQDPSFAASLHQFDLLLPDGQGLIWASKFLASKTPAANPPARTLSERIAGREVVAELLAEAQQRQLPTLVIGGRGYNDQVIAGSHLPSNTLYKVVATDGYSQAARPTNQEEKELQQLITKLKPAIVFVALGAPYQEKWVVAHRALLESAGVRIAMVVGGSFDYLLGRVPRAPQLVVQLKLEWLFRLVTQPWRWRRQLSLITFVGMVLQARK